MEKQIDVIVCTKGTRQESLLHVLKQIKREIPVNSLYIIYRDMTQELKEKCQAFTKVTYLIHDNYNGLGYARKLGVDLASTEIIAFIDDDVVLPSNWFNDLYSNFSDPRIVTVMGVCIYVAPGTFPSYSDNWGCNNLLLKRDIAQKLGNFNASLNCAEDYELYLRILENNLIWKVDKNVFVLHPCKSKEDLSLRMKEWSKAISYVNSFRKKTNA